MDKMVTGKKILIIGGALLLVAGIVLFFIAFRKKSCVSGKSEDGKKRKYKCVEGQCLEDVKGKYDSPTDCSKNCYDPVVVDKPN